MELTNGLSSFSVLMIGFVLGLQHATEADHLAAVSTIVSEKKSLFTSSIVGGLWGLGHTISLFTVGLIVIFLKVRISETVEARLEALVGVMLVVLGVNALRKLLKSKRVHLHAHDHGTRLHSHIHLHGEEPLPVETHHKLSPRSVIIGMIHGLAGSAALMLLVLPSIDSTGLAMLYIVIFGVGSIGGMMAMSFLIGLPFHFTANRYDVLNKAIRLCAGVFSMILGSKIIYEKML